MAYLNWRQWQQGPHTLTVQRAHPGHAKPE